MSGDESSFLSGRLAVLELLLGRAVARLPRDARSEETRVIRETLSALQKHPQKTRANEGAIFALEVILAHAKKVAAESGGRFSDLD